MSLILKGTTNSNNLYLNDILLIDEKGYKIIIDRDNTEWGVSNGVISIQWKNLYIWKSLEGKCNNSKLDINEAFQNAVDFKIEIEDDAPEGYELEITEIYYNYEVTDEMMYEISKDAAKIIEKNTGIDINNDIDFSALHLFSKMKQDLISVYKVLKKEDN